ncbi:hypothetical protein B0H34DRAFT_857475 [Crassisporium funariophilum]|nr:hypothetical protein B0H34DRAFT_857475 [Crassisporium funariophilum]
MTRGRKKDLTIPPTRTLVQQRDYRARKATYIASLEERCRRVEEENAQLRKELMDTRARLNGPAILHPETAEASTELMHHLSLATVSLARFQRLAFSNVAIQLDVPPNNGPQPTPDVNICHRPLPSSSSQLAPLEGAQRPSRKRLHREISPPYARPTLTSLPLPYSPTSDSGSECCGGFFDCELLGCDQDHQGRVCDHDRECDVGIRETASRMSGLRSTSDHMAD